MNKMIAVILVCAMIFSLSAAVAADEMPATPTVEEILDEYHQELMDVHFYLDSGGLAIDSNSKYLFSHYSPTMRN